MKNRNSVLENYIYNLFYNLLVIFMPMLTLPFVMRRLGDTNLGIFNFQQSIVGYFILFGCIGLNIYAHREIAYCGDNVEKRSATFFEIITLRFATLLISLVLFLIFIVKNSEFPQYYLLFAVEIVATMFDIGWLYQGVENFRAQAFRNSFIKLTSVICIMTFVKDENDLWVYIICHTGAVLLGNISTWFGLHNYIVRVNRKLNYRRHIKPALLLFIPQAASGVYTLLDKTMVGIMTEYNEVAYYGQSDKLVRLALTIVTSLGFIMLSRIAVSFAQNDKEKIVLYITKSFKFIFLIAFPCMFGLMAVTYRFVPWFFGDGWMDVVPCMMAMCPLILLVGCSNVIGTQYLLPTNQTKKYTISVLIGMFVNLILNLFLVREWGSSGAAAASVIAESVVVFAQFMFVRKMFSFRILKYSIKNFISALIMGIAVFALSLRLEPSIANTSIEILVGCVLYFLLLFMLRDKFFIELIKQTKNFIKEKLGH